MYNFLTDPMMRIVKSDGSRGSASLPEVYAALVADLVEAFPALRPHQRHAWHAFLVQLGAMAMHRAGIGEPPDEPEEWLSIIRGLTAAFPNDEPWQLMVDDITRPAFMQPPSRSIDRESDYKNVVLTPDELDMLVTSKNHDLKSAVAIESAVDDWLYALITLQTMEGFSGQGNYGISRMNGGMSSRPAFSTTIDRRPGVHVKRDIMALLEHRQSLMEEHSLPDRGHTLLWTLPWDGATAEALALNSLDLHYLEVCRRIRFRRDEDGRLYAVRANSKAARVEAKAIKGMTGDPWTLINQKEGKALTLANGGFTYRRTAEYLFSADWQRPVLLKPTEEEIRSPGTMTLVARGMVRGQGKTEGYYERAIPVRKRLQTAMLRQGGTVEIGQIATSRIEGVAKVQRILSHSIQVFLARGDSDDVSPEHRTLARPWLNRLEEHIDETFFEDLQDEFETEAMEDRERVRNRWLLGVVDHARTILGEATDSLPCPSFYRFKARSGAEGLFEGRIRGNQGLPNLFP